MRHRLLRISLLAFVVAWFGVVVPGHRRGQIALAGWRQGCCATTCTDHPKTDRTPQPASCAICHFLAVLDLPTPVQISIPPLAIAQRTDLIPQPCHFSADVRLTCCERGPPIA